MINIKGLNKAKVLRELYNGSKVQGMGFSQATGVDMSIREAKNLLKHDTHFDYLHGKVMKVDLTTSKQFDEWGYDRDNGQGAAQSIIDKLR